MPGVACGLEVGVEDLDEVEDDAARERGQQHLTARTQRAPWAAAIGFVGSGGENISRADTALVAAMSFFRGERGVVGRYRRDCRAPGPWPRAGTAARARGSS